MRWAYLPADQRWHLLPEGGQGPEARCARPRQVSRVAVPADPDQACPACRTAAHQ